MSLELDKKSWSYYRKKYRLAHAINKGYTWLCIPFGGLCMAYGGKYIMLMLICCSAILALIEYVSSKLENEYYAAYYIKDCSLELKNDCAIYTYKSVNNGEYSYQISYDSVQNVKDELIDVRMTGLMLQSSYGIVSNCIYCIHIPKALAGFDEFINKLNKGVFVK